VFLYLQLCDGLSGVSPVILPGINGQFIYSNCCRGTGRFCATPAPRWQIFWFRFRINFFSVVDPKFFFSDSDPELFWPDSDSECQDQVFDTTIFYRVALIAFIGLGIPEPVKQEKKVVL
jgi:hypothetical protein